MKLGESGLRSGEIAGLQSLADRVEVLLACGDGERVSVSEGAVLAQVLDGSEILLSSGKVAGLERLP